MVVTHKKPPPLDRIDASCRREIGARLVVVISPEAWRIDEMQAEEVELEEVEVQETRHRRRRGLITRTTAVGNRRWWID